MRQIKLAHVFKFFGLLSLAMMVSGCQGIALLDPKGPIGAQEKDLILMAIGLALIIIIPVVVMVVWFSIRYREKNGKATYKPHWEGNVTVEVLIWLIPVLIIFVLSYLTWVKTIDLDPYKPITTAERPLKVQVVSMDWNWLFIYPDYNVASINELDIPEGVPVTFDLTSATVMSSFFIPDLGSQIYAMAGMVTHLNLLADHPGTFIGHNLEFSGIGYAKMNFNANALPKDQFEAWIRSAKEKTNALTLEQFKKMNKPQSGIPAATFSSVEPELFGRIVGEFMATRGAANQGTAAAPMADMPGDSK